MNYTLNIHSKNSEVKYSLYDGFDKLHLKNESKSKSIKLRKGIYILEAELNGIVKQVKIRLNKDQFIDIPTPIYSSAPILYAETTIKDKLLTGLEYSKKLTHPSSSRTVFENTGLFLFLRSSDLKNETIDLDNFKVSILDDSKEILCEIDTSNSKIDEDRYWLSFSRDFNFGQYYIIVESKEINWCMPFYIYPSIKANIFISVNKSPLYKSVKVFYNKGNHSYDVDNEHNFSTDIALDRITNYKFDDLPKKTMNDLLDGKFDYPMFGFISLYFLLFRKEKPNTALVTKVINNMEEHILSSGTSPELDVLKRISNIKLGTSFRIEKNENVLAPMFNLGLKTIVDEWTNNHTLFDENNIINEALENLLPNSPFSIWEIKPQIKNKENQFIIGKRNETVKHVKGREKSPIKTSGFIRKNLNDRLSESFNLDGKMINSIMNHLTPDATNNDMRELGNMIPDEVKVNSGDMLSGENFTGSDELLSGDLNLEREQSKSSGELFLSNTLDDKLSLGEHLLNGLDIDEEKLNGLIEYLILGGKYDELTIGFIVRQLKISPYRIRKIIYVTNGLIIKYPELLSIIIKNFNNKLGFINDDKQLALIEKNIKLFLHKSVENIK